MQNKVWFTTQVTGNPRRTLSSYLLSKVLIKPALLFFLLSNQTLFSFSQKIDSTKATSHFTSVVSITTKGISTIPSFTLGKPAVIFDMSIGKRRLSFEPQLRFALEGKPWSFLFWWRYKLLTTDKFQINLGAHPALNFRTETVSSNGVSKEVIVSRRYLAGELSPNYSVAKNISVGLYYLYSRGLEKDVARNTQFLGVRSNFSNIELPGRYFMGFTPQLYFLKADKPDGFYFTSTLTLAMRNFPLSISSIINKSIKTEIAGQNFLWNVTLIYSFNREYAEIQYPVF